MNTQNVYEKKSYNADFPVQIFYEHRRQCGIQCGAHWHEEIEIAYIQKGSSIFTLGQEEYPLKEGDFLLINKNTVHSAVCTSTPYICQAMAFCPENIMKDFLPEDICFQSFIANDKDIKYYMEHIFQECEEQLIGYKDNCKSYITQLFVYLLRNYRQEDVSKRFLSQQKSQLSRLDIVLNYINDNYTEPITNRELAKLLYLSEDHFGHLFRKNIGLSPQKYITQLRMQKAQALIQEKEHTITEIALMVGYQDYNHFGRLFRRYFHCTPSEMAKNNVYISDK